MKKVKEMVQFRKVNVKKHTQIFKKYKEGGYRYLVYAINY